MTQTATADRSAAEHERFVQILRTMESRQAADGDDCVIADGALEVKGGSSLVVVNPFDVQSWRTLEEIACPNAGFLRNMGDLVKRRAGRHLSTLVRAWQLPQKEI